jgi:DnaJ-class molecular chaperone
MHNLYKLLNVERDATVETIAGAMERLTRQASALANTAPERSQQMRENIREVREFLLSGEEQRRRYDEQLQISDEQDRARAAAAAAADRPITLLDPELGSVVSNAVQLIRAGLYTAKASKIGKELDQQQP